MRDRLLPFTAVALFSAAAVLLGACGQEEPTGPPDIVADVDVWPHEIEVQIGSTEELRVDVAVVGNPTHAVRWESSDSTIATVDSTGVVTAVSQGTTAVTATSVADSTKRDSAVVLSGVSCEYVRTTSTSDASNASTLPVSTQQVVTEVAIHPDSMTVAVGRESAYTAEVTHCIGVSDDVVWNLRDTTLASIDTHGVVTGRRPGTTRVTATVVTDPAKEASAFLAVVDTAGG